MVTVYGYGSCSTCRQAVKHVRQTHAVEWKDIVENPPHVEELRHLVKMYGGGIEPFLNRHGTRFRELGLAKKELSEDQWLEALSHDGWLIKRPIVTDGKRVVIGFDPPALQSLEGNQ